MARAHSKRDFSLYVSYSVAKVEALSGDGERLGWATGFFIDELDYLSLYTCWHVVSGADPHNLPAIPPKKREKIRVHTMQVEHQESGTVMTGGLNTFTLNLYDSQLKPTWTQSPPQAEHTMADLPPPLWDCVRFNFEAARELLPGWFEPADDINQPLDMSDDAFIVGYPFGFSPYRYGTDPIFLRRNPASWWGPDYFALLSGGGVKGMSGGPVVVWKNSEWRFAGIYTGAVFPEHLYFPDELNPKKPKSELPLGKYIRSWQARRAVGVAC